jgi:hypothetical protein
MTCSYSLPLLVRMSFHQGRLFCASPWCTHHIPAICIPACSHKWMHWDEWLCTNVPGMLPICGSLQRQSRMNNTRSNSHIFSQHWSEGGSSAAVPSVVMHPLVEKVENHCQRCQGNPHPHSQPYDPLMVCAHVHRVHNCVHNVCRC